ncbi:MAG: FAD:protein FMN transferase [Arthrobacter sp.]|uniref:FAD:protein FMN transferase n=1 Tax=Arthrobacter TaxID=1663 RepID=UPI0026553793|nr:FAD:protein FMN transferase [Micrococcaceae bacterium]
MSVVDEATGGPADPRIPELAHRSFQALGTTVGISAPLEPDELDAAVETVQRIFLDAQTSFGVDGQGPVESLRRGDIELRYAHRRLRALYEQATVWRQATDGAYTPHTSTGPVDLSGLVKGWAIAHAGQAMMDLQLPHWSVTAGGDVLCSGSPFPAEPTGTDPFYGRHWRAGITDPFDPATLVADVPLAGTPGFTAALATTSTGAGSGPNAYLQVSVLAEEIVTADVLSQAIMVGGESTLEAAVRDFGVAVLVCGHDGELLASSTWPLQQSA